MSADAGWENTAVVNPWFAAAPYHVESFPGHSAEGWHCVCNRNGFNCMRFTGKPGAIFTTLENATEICKRWNGPTLAGTTT